MFEILKQADIRQGEFAALVGVSRVTVNLWCRGKWKPHKLISSKVHEVLTQLHNAVAAGRLPLPASSRRAANRKDTIAATLTPVSR